MDNFRLIINKIAADSILTSEIIRLQDKFCRNSLFYLTTLRDDIVSLLKKKIPDLDDPSLIDVANFLSGLHAYEIKLKVAHIKKMLPHFSKWYINAMSVNNVVELFEIEQVINTAHSNLCNELIEDGNLKDIEGTIEDPESEMSKIANRVRILDSLKTMHCKSNRTVSDTVKKYFEVEEIQNLDEVFNNYESSGNT